MKSLEEDYSQHSDIYSSSIQAILERLKQEQGGSSSPTSPTKPKKRRRRKRDIRTVRRLERERKRNWTEEEKADARRWKYGTLRGQYHNLRREIKRRREGGGQEKYRGKCWEWTLTLAEWLEIWSSCKMLDHGFNNKVPAWKLRGRNSKTDVQIRRIDANKPFEFNNMTVVRGQEVLYPCSNELGKE